MNNNQDQLSRDELTVWMHNPVTEVLFEALRRKKQELADQLLLDVDNIVDPHLDRRVVQHSGAFRALHQILDKEELIALLEDYNLIKENVNGD